MSRPDDLGHPATPGVRPFLQAAPSGGDGAGSGEQTGRLRPFVITAGRTGPDPGIGVETQVTAHPGVVPGGLPPEKRAIVTLCAEPLSVAEISARLRLHLGVVRILVGDLRDTGQLDVHVLDNEFPDPDTILRVIRGLRAIS